MTPEETTVEITGDTDIVAARYAGRTIASACGFSSSDITLIATAISELARNILEYAGEGEVAIRSVERDGRPGVEIIARDQGPGIRDVTRAMEDGFSSGNGLGLGLPGTRRLMDEFSIASGPGKGTTVTARKWR